MAYRVQCVTTDGSSAYNDCRSITTIGIPSKSGGVNTYSPEQIHDRIEDDGDVFFVEHEGMSTHLEAVNDGDTRYVRTESNDTTEDNLLQQPSC